MKRIILPRTVCPCILCDCHIHRERSSPEAVKRSQKHVSRASVLLLDWSRFRGADSSDCLVEDSGVGLVVAAVTRSATTHDLLLQTLSLFPTLFPARSVSGDLSFHGFSHLRRSSLSKITALSASALVCHHLLSTTFTIKWPRNCDCFT